MNGPRHRRGTRQLWNDFFFRPVPAYSLGLFRIAFAAVVLLNLGLLAPDALTWFGEKGTLPLDDAMRLSGGFRINVLAWLPATDLTVQCFIGSSFLVALSVLVGWRTRMASVLLWICLTSLHHRNLFVLNSGDTLMRNLAFFLIFAPSDKAYSLDRYFRIRRGLEEPGVPLIAPWPIRLMQIQICVMYLSTVLWKVSGTCWCNGTAVYYITRLDSFKHYPTPAFMQDIWFSKFATWSSLATELALPILVWFRRTRYPVLLAGVLLHLGLEYTMNVPVFQWVVLSSLLLFVDPEYIGRIVPFGKPALEATDEPLVGMRIVDRSGEEREVELPVETASKRRRFDRPHVSPHVSPRAPRLKAARTKRAGRKK